MKKIFTLLFIGLFISVNAQIIYTESDGPRIGLTVFTRDIQSPDKLDLNKLLETGGNKSWDIRGAFDEGTTFDYEPVDNLSYKDKFPGCNLARFELPSFDNSNYMLEKNISGVYLLGIHNDLVDVVLSPKFKVTQFPLHFGDNYQNSTSSDFKIDTVDIKLDIQSNSTVDSWGMLTTNDGTYPVLKLKTVQIREISIDGIPYGSTYFTYSWLTSGIGQALATLIISEEESLSGLTSDTTASYAYRQTVANEEFLAKEERISIIPNPASDYATIKCVDIQFSSASYVLINADGKTVMEGNFIAKEDLHLNLKQLPAGSYLIQIILDKKTMLFDILSKN